MRKLLFATLLLTMPAMADDAYKFHLRVTDARSALLANSTAQELKMSPEQLDRAAKDRVVLLDKATGAHWRWLMLSWPAPNDVEQGINSRGAAKPGQNADIGLTPAAERKARVRCYRERCHVRVATPDLKETTVTMTNGESKEFPVDSDFDLAFEGR